jgi:hypothetical protein
METLYKKHYGQSTTQKKLNKHMYKIQLEYMFSVLPREIVYRILDIYANDIGDGYMFLRLVNKQISTYVIGTARNYVRSHCILEGGTATLDDRLSRRAPCLQLKHKYLHISISVQPRRAVSTADYRLKSTDCHIYIGWRGTAFNISRRSADCGGIVNVSPGSLQDHAWIIDFIRKYFDKLYDCLASLYDD